jgi:hypothetical protein
MVSAWNCWEFSTLLVRPIWPGDYTTQGNAGGRKKWRQWLKQVRLRDVPQLARILARTQVLMDPKAYLAETRIRGG